MGVRAWILLAPMMVLIMAPPSSKACSCIYHHPQSFFCKKDIVMKGQFLNASETNNTINGYYIKAEEVYKGSISQDAVFVGSLAGTSCEYTHSPDNFHKDYLITVYRGTNSYYVNGCDFIGLWSQLSSGQIKGFQGDYAKECGCEVNACFWSVCSTSEKQCEFDLYDESVRQDQERNQICAQNEQGICTWQTIE